MRVVRLGEPSHLEHNPCGSINVWQAPRQKLSPGHGDLLKQTLCTLKGWNLVDPHQLICWTLLNNSSHREHRVIQFLHLQTNQT